MSNATLEPQMVEFIRETESFYPADSAGRPIAEQRRLYDAYAAHMTPPRPPGVTSQDRHLALPGRSIDVRLTRDAASGAKGVIVYLHGGGFVLGGLDSHEIVTAHLAARTGATVVTVDYRLAPEHTFPAAFEDARDAVQWVRAEWPQRKIVAIGDSAGGNLCTAVATHLRDTGAKQLDGMVLFYPTLAPDPMPPACDDHAQAPMLTLADVLWYKEAYLSGAAPTPYSSPLLATRYDGLPPTLLLPVEIDPLRDDATTLHARIKAAGGTSELVVGKGLLHGALRALGRSPGIDALMQRAVDFALAHLI
ncbi:alpha/beta hydrolase [Methylovirgula sp. 4M-Z18]|uniref:alpha/beta hydrolase n=1 Tax=Methylovirgula sp. 4M-Z18 TaxID=2293567 RepID=UPI000E2F5A96|nr:alpha/beta hydrolase [Methylovirgula sp. 4M-Z18]RFB81003.1 alpha/beta hydrolase [Methylovirgula sp. 4M-Z18]